MTILRSAFSDAVDPFIVCREAIDYWSETMDKFLRERDRLPNNRICDIQYDEIRREPIAQFGGSTNFSAGHCRGKQSNACAYLVASQAERQSANHRYDLSQFGSSAEEVLSVFATYCQRFGLAQPSGVQAEASSALGRLIRCRGQNSRMTFEAIRIIRANHPTFAGAFSRCASRARGCNPRRSARSAD